MLIIHIKDDESIDRALKRYKRKISIRWFGKRTKKPQTFCETFGRKKKRNIECSVSPGEVWQYERLISDSLRGVYNIYVNHIS
jgi:ribosomal protein S21